MSSAVGKMMVSAPTVFIATMDTPSFSFMAVGASHDGAMAALVDVMRRHREQYGAETWHPGNYPGGADRCGIKGIGFYPMDDAAWLTWLAIEWYAAHVVELAMGHGARDGEALG